jgi:hypothetical protein
MITYIKYKKPIVSDVFCDKFSATLKIDNNYYYDILKSIHEHIDNGYAKESSKPNYKQSIELFLGSESEYSALIQAAPYKKGYAFFRIEFNPQRIGSEGLSELKLRLDNILPNGYESLIQHGICTRIDATIDIHHVAVNRLCFYLQNMQKSKAYFKKGKILGCANNIGSYYTGSDDSQKQFCAYDKVQEIKNHNSNYPHNKIQVPDHPITRIEIKNRKRIPITSLPTIPNQFINLSVYSFHKTPKIDWKFDLFIKAVRSEGAQNSLLALPEPIKKLYRERLETAKVLFFQPEEHWKKWPKVMNEILYPTVSPLALPKQAINIF